MTASSCYFVIIAYLCQRPVGCSYSLYIVKLHEVLNKWLRNH